GADLRDAVKGEQRASAVEHGVTIDAALTILFLVEMRIPAGRTEPRRAHGQFRRRRDTRLIAHAQDRLPDPVGTALMVDDRLRTELRQAEKARPTQKAVAADLLPARREKRHQRQPGEVVAR